MARVRRQPPNPIFTCTTCGDHFKHRSTWNRHMRDKHRGESICGYCPRQMKRKHIMKTHLREVHGLTGQELDDAWRRIEISSQQNYQVGRNALHSVNQIRPHPPGFEQLFTPAHIDPQIMTLPRLPTLPSQRGAIDYTTKGYETLRTPLMTIHHNLALRQGNLIGAGNPVRVESFTGQEGWSEVIGTVDEQLCEGAYVWQAGSWNHNSSKKL